MQTRVGWQQGNQIGCLHVAVCMWPGGLFACGWRLHVRIWLADARVAGGSGRSAGSADEFQKAHLCCYLQYFSVLTPSKNYPVSPWPWPGPEDAPRQPKAPQRAATAAPGWPKRPQRTATGSPREPKDTIEYHRIP